MNRKRSILQIHTHRSTKTTVDFEDGELLEVGRVLWLWEVSIGHDLIFGRGFDTIPIAASMVSWEVKREAKKGRTCLAIEPVLRDSG